MPIDSPKGPDKPDELPKEEAWGIPLNDEGKRRVEEFIGAEQPSVSLEQVGGRELDRPLEYDEVARVIHLWLKEWCDESLPYSDMCADAARKVKSAYDAKIAELQSAVTSLEQMRTEMERVVKERDDIEAVAKGVGAANSKLREQVARLEGERDAFKYAHEQWQKSGDRIVSLERELAEERERNWHTGYQKLRAELADMTALKDKAADIAIAIGFEHNQKVKEIEANKYTISETQGALNRANEEIATLKNQLAIATTDELTMQTLRMFQQLEPEEKEFILTKLENLLRS